MFIYIIKKYDFWILLKNYFLFNNNNNNLLQHNKKPPLIKNAEIKILVLVVNPFKKQELVYSWFRLMSHEIIKLIKKILTVHKTM